MRSKAGRPGPSGREQARGAEAGGPIAGAIRGAGHEGKALIAAGLLHLLVLGLPAVLPAKSTVLPPISTNEPATAEFDVETTPLPASPKVEEPESTEGPSPAPERPASAGASRAKTVIAPKDEAPPPPLPEAPAAEAPAAEAPVAEAVGPTGTTSPPVGQAPPAGEAPPAGPDRAGEYSPIPADPGGLPPGMGSSPVWALPGVLGPAESAPAATTPAPARPVNGDIAGQVLRGTLQAKDHSLGLALPAAGVVASTLGDAVRSAGVPNDARATFEVGLGAGGEVRGIRVVSSSKGDAATWERAAGAAKAALSGRALKMGNGAEGGATVTVKVESSQVYAAGNKKKYEVKPVCANEVIEDVAMALQPLVGSPPSEDRGPAAAAPRAKPGPSAEGPAALDAEERRRFCIPIGIAGKGDLSNLGTHLQTVVRSTYQVSVAGARKLPSDAALPLDKRAPWLAPDASKAPKPPGKPWKKKKKKKPE